MNIFASFWDSWAQLFRIVPYGDPWIAAFGLIAMAVLTYKLTRSAMGHA